MTDAYRSFVGDKWLHRYIRLADQLFRMAEDSAYSAAAPMALSRTGKKANVYKLVRMDGEAYALKVFFRMFSLFENFVITGKLERFGSVPGLRVCQRKVIRDEEAKQVGETGLSWSILMPWIEGEPWVDYVEARRAIAQDSCIALARHTAAVLAGLERRGLAHADISSSNVVVTSLGPKPAIELIDVEDMYHRDFIDMPFVPDGTPGYAHPANKGKGCRNRYGDRFAASILLAEMLTWHDPRVRGSADDISVFAQHELCRDGAKYTTVRNVLRSHSARAADLFERAWRSPGLSSCPALSEWVDALATARPATSTLSVPLQRPPMRVRPFRDLVATAHDPRHQTSIVAVSTCADCGRRVAANSPSDHAVSCVHHPLQVARQFNFSAWRRSEPETQVSPAMAALLKKYSTPPATRGTDLTQLRFPLGRDRPVPPATGAKDQPTVPRFNDISFIPLTDPTSGPWSKTGFQSPSPVGRPATRSCASCGRTVTGTAGSERGHKLTCPDGSLWWLFG